jgi:hypothetical protein
MISAKDFILLPYSPDLTQGGIAYACRSLNYTYNRMGGSPYARLRRIVGGVAVELAFRHYLTSQAVPFDVRGATPFTEPDRYDVSLGGHRCDIKSFLITRRPQISEIRRDPSVLLQAPALIPSDQFAAQTHTAQDLYLFGFLSTLTAASQEDVRKAHDSGQSIYLMHAFPKEWSQPNQWIPLGRLALKSEAEQPVEIEIGGQNGERDFITEQITLPPRKRVELGNSFFSLAYVHAKGIPSARIGVHSPVRKETYLIQPAEWGNIWLYGMDIWLTGYLSHEEFRLKASHVAEGSHVFQYNVTRTKNLGVAVKELNPLGELLERVKAWETKKSFN